MNTLRELTIKNPIISTIVFFMFTRLIIGFISNYLGIFVFNMDLDKDLSYNLFSILSCIIISLICIKFMSSLYSFRLLGLGTQGLTQGMLYGLTGLLLTPGLLFILVIYPSVSSILPQFKLTLNILFSAFTVFLLAFIEELLIRGMYVNILFYPMQKTRANVWRVLILSSVLFSVGYLPFFVSVYKQSAQVVLLTILLRFLIKVIYGVFYGILYLKSTNLWVATLCHGINNLIILLPEFLNNKKFSISYELNHLVVTENKVAEMTETFLCMLPLIPYCIFLVSRFVSEKKKGSAIML